MLMKLTYKIPVLVYNDDGERMPELDKCPQVLDIAADAFNDDHVGQYLNLPIYSCRMCWNQEHELLVECFFLESVWNAYPYWRERTQEELDGQMSDGWGEGFEQFSYTVQGQNQNGSKHFS